MKFDLFIDPWQSSNSQKFIQELQKETCESHELYGASLEIVARRSDRDEYLFKYIDEDKYAQVHLTWRGEVEPDPYWPRTTIYNSFEQWKAVIMIPNNVRYGSEEE
jgi:hypothetical protein